jgi:hypothetical protein
MLFGVTPHSPRNVIPHLMRDPGAEVSVGNLVRRSCL